jgi:hypothetical protein
MIRHCLSPEQELAAVTTKPDDSGDGVDASPPLYAGSSDVFI